MNPQPDLFRALSGNSNALAAQQRLQRLSLRWLRIIGWCLIALTVIAAGMILSATRSIFMPVIAGIVVGLIIGPLGDRARKLGVPSGVSFTLIVLALASGFVVAGTLILPALDTLAAAVPVIKDKLETLSHLAEGWLGGARLFVGSRQPLDQATVIDWASKALSVLTPALSQALIFLFTLILFLAGRQELRRNLTLAIKGRDKRLLALKTLANVENRLSDYFLVVGVINLGLAMVVWVVFLVLGVPGAERWAALVFLLNFLPVVGPLLVKAGLLAYALVFAPGVFAGLLPLFAFLGISLVEANLVTPRIVGQRMTMNPLLVFVSVIFWTWLWGFPGAFLAMPFLAIASAIIAENGARTTPQLPG